MKPGIVYYADGNQGTVDFIRNKFAGGYGICDLHQVAHNRTPAQIESVKWFGYETTDTTAVSWKSRIVEEMIGESAYLHRTDGSRLTVYADNRYIWNPYTRGWADVLWRIWNERRLTNAHGMFMDNCASVLWNVVGGNATVREGYIQTGTPDFNSWYWEGVRRVLAQLPFPLLQNISGDWHPDFCAGNPSERILFMEGRFCPKTQGEGYWGGAWFNDYRNRVEAAHRGGVKVWMQPETGTNYSNQASAWAFAKLIGADVLGTHGSTHSADGRDVLFQAEVWADIYGTDTGGPTGGAVAFDGGYQSDFANGTVALSTLSGDGYWMENPPDEDDTPEPDSLGDAVNATTERAALRRAIVDVERYPNNIARLGNAMINVGMPWPQYREAMPDDAQAMVDAARAWLRANR